MEGRSPGDSASLSVLTKFLWHGKFLIAFTALLGLLVGLVITRSTPPSYRARMSLQLEGFNDRVLQQVTPISPQLHNATAENYLQNEVKLLQSETLAARIAAKVGSQPEHNARSADILSWFAERLSSASGLGTNSPAGPESAEERRISAVKKAMTVRTSLQSQVIELFYDAPDPTAAALGANTAASEYINLNREARTQLVQDTTEWLGKQGAELKAKLDRANQQLRDFASRTGLLYSDSQNAPIIEPLRQTQEAFARAQADRATKQSRFEAATANPKDLSLDQNNPGSLKQYQEDLQKVRRDLAELRTLYTSDHHKVRRLEAQAAETEAAIEREHKAHLARMRAEYVAATGLERLLADSLARQKQLLVRQGDNERQYNIRKSEIDTTQRLYDSMLQKITEAGAASALRITNIRIIDPAIAPATPYSPKLPLNLAIGFGIGTLGGVGLVLMRSSDKVRQPGETAMPDTPELGVVPSSRATLRLNSPLNVLTPGRSREQMKSMFRESFRDVLTSILFNSNLTHNRMGTSGPILVVTSTDVMEGKTTVVTNLGMASAEMKRRVLLIDADLRRPRLHERFQLFNGKGLTDLLKQEAAGSLDYSESLREYLQPTEISGLWVLTSGSGSADLIYSVDIAPILGRLQKDFDLVFIDTPPLTLYSDARIFGRVSDGVVMVVRANTKSRVQLKAAFNRLVQDQIPILGTILNDWRMEDRLTKAYSRY